MSQSEADTAGVVASPPLIFAGAVAGGLLIQRVRALPLMPLPLGKPLGAAFAVAGVGLGLAAVSTLKRAGTNVDPYEETSAIVEKGPYRFTRNPIYLAMALLSAGIGLFASSGWVFALLPAALATLQKGVVEREEAYLVRRFPDVYPAYKERVRRWL